MTQVKVTKLMSEKLCIPVGGTIEYDRLLTNDELPPENHGLKIALNIYHNGERIGGKLHLEEE